MLKSTQLRPGMIIMHEGDLHVVYSVDHRTPGNKRGSMQTKMRNLRSGSMMDYRFRAEEFVEKVTVDEIEFEYLYSDGDGHHFMNTQNYEQLALQEDIVGDTKDYLISNLPVKIEYYDGKAIGVLALLGIASPILELRDPVHGIIGLVILFVGIRFAWRFTAGRTFNVSGPHTPSQAGVI